jgi:PAS domain S-box-containing protein
MRFDIYKLQRFNFVLDTVSEGWWDNNFETQKVYWSENLFKMLGYDRKEDFITMEIFLTYVHPDDAGPLAAEFERCVNEDIPFEYELRLRHANGKYITCMTRAKGYYDDNGKVIGYAGLVTDLTRRVRDEILLKESNLRLEYLNKFGKSLAGHFKLEEIVNEVTETATKASGAEFGAFFYNVEDVSGESYMLYKISGVPRDKFENFPMPRNTEVFSPTFTGQGTVISDDITKDPRYGKNEPYHGMPPGHLPVKSYLAVPVVLSDGDVLGGLFFGHSEVGVFNKEIALLIEGIASQAAIAIENARLFTGLELSEANFRMLSDSIPEIVAILNKDANIEYANKRWYEYTGLNTEDLKANKGRELIHPEDKDRFLNRYLESIREGKSLEAEFRFKRHDGVYRWQLIRTVPIKDKEGNIVKWVSATTDIDERKRSERRKDEFMGIASHELKTPLTSVKAYMQLIQKEIGDSDNKLAQYVNKATHNIDKLSQIISDLLDVSKIQSGMLKLSVSRFNFDELMDDVTEGMQYTSYNHEIRVEERSDAYIVADRTRLEQVMINFLSNAIKYSPNGGRIIVRSNVSEGKLNFSVQDFGIGISDENKKYVFDKYFRVQAPVEEFSGVGIGLFISKEIIDRHNGKTWVESKEGKGSTFHFQIPLISEYG